LHEYLLKKVLTAKARRILELKKRRPFGVNLSGKVQDKSFYAMFHQRHIPVE
jgi:hypothetical protein